MYIFKLQAAGFVYEQNLFTFNEVNNSYHKKY